MLLLDHEIRHGHRGRKCGLIVREGDVMGPFSGGSIANCIGPAHLWLGYQADLWPADWGD